MSNELQIYFSLESVSDEYGGPIRSISRLQNMLRLEDLNASIIHTALTPSASDPYPEFNHVITLWVGLPKLIGRVIAGKRSLVIFNNQWSFSVQLLSFVCLILRIPYIWWVRGVPSFRGSLKKWIVWHGSQKWLMAGAQTIIGSSSKSLERIQCQLPKTDANLIDIPNIVECPEVVKRVSTTRPKLQNTFEINLLSVGRFHRSKRVLELVENCPLQIGDKSVRLTLVGYVPEPSYLNSVMTTAKKINLNTLIKRNISNEELIKLYENSDIFISLSKIENFGNAVGEALAYGLPVVVNEETDFWPMVDYAGVIVCSDSQVKAALDRAVEFCESRPLPARRREFAMYWRHFSEKKYKEFSDLCNSFID